MMKLNEQLSAMASKYPDHAAYIFQDKETSYKEFERQVKKFASGLEKLGYKKGDHVALIAWNSPLYVVAFYGMLRMGVVIIPVKPISTSNEIKYVLEDANVKAVVTNDEILDDSKELADHLQAFNHYFISQLVEDGSVEYDAPKLDKDNTAMLLYTSGTTGSPKGTILTYENIYANAFMTADFLKYNKNDRIISVLPMAHVFGIGATLCGPLLRGATLLICDKFSPKEVFRIAESWKATVFAGVPTMYSYLWQTAKKQTAYQKCFSGIRLCLSGGASISLSLLNDFEKMFNVTIIEGYGLSEVAPVTYNPINQSSKQGSIGKILPQVECKIVDDSGEEVATGEVGELLVKGPNLMKGYYRLPEATAMTIKNGWFHTGDLVRIDKDGYYYIVDRIKDIIIVKGFNVYPREVEEVLYKHPDVVEAAVIGTPDPETGEAIISFVSVSNDSISEENLLCFCKSNLTKYKVPKRIRIMSELPKNATGKIMKKSLPLYPLNPA